MSEQTEIIAYHGWGFDQSCWQEWQILCQSCGIKFQCFDRGYFGQPQYPVFEAEPNSSDSSAAGCRKIVFAHSYGLHLCPIEHLHRADVLVVFSSFYGFHPDREPAKRRSIAMLNQMQQQFKHHPQPVLHNFKLKCYHPLTCPPAFPRIVNGDLLLHDLEALNVSRWNFPELTPASRVMILHGSSDRIVGSHQGQALCEQLSIQHQAIEVQYIEIQQAGHALPFTHLHDCWSFIRSVVLL